MASITGFRLMGRGCLSEGLRFDSDKILIDPYSHAVGFGRNYSRQRAIDTGSNMDACMKSIVVDHSDFDWQGDVAPRHSLTDTIIYEMHVAGFHPPSLPPA